MSGAHDVRVIGAAAVGWPGLRIDKRASGTLLDCIKDAIPGFHVRVCSGGVFE